MSTDAFRERYLRERVLTATPVQRVVMIYDRLDLDLARAAAIAEAQGDVFELHGHLDHAVQIVIELRSSLDSSAGGPADNLASLYGYLIGELLTIRGGALDRLAAARQVVDGLRQAWTRAAEQLAGTDSGAAPVAAGAWVS